MAQPKTKAILTTSIKVYAIGSDSARHQVGILSNINPEENRDITYSFVLGNNPPDEPVELIPGPPRSKTLTCSCIAYYSSQALKTLGGRDDQDIVAALSDQNTPFIIQEEISNPNDVTTKTREYKGCFIGRYGATRNIGAGDTRVMENVTIHYQSVEESDWV